MISARDVHKQYRDGETVVDVLTGLTLDVRRGEFVAVVGRSGSGKSTLLHLLGGLDREYRGDIEVDGISLRGLDDRGLARFRQRHVGFVFQSFHLVPSMTALENVLLPAHFGDSVPGAAERARAAAALERVGLGTKTERTPGRLSGGERQRVAIARALFGQPAVLLCDEPTGNLDAQTGAEIIDLFRGLHADGQTIVAVTHEERLSAAAGRVLQVRGGKLEEGRRGNS